MLPDFPKSRGELHKKLRLRIYLASQAKSPLRALGKSIAQHEGILHSYDQITDSGIRNITEGMQEVAVPIEVKIDEIPELVGEKLLARVDAIAEETARQISQMTFRKMDEVTHEAGMAVDAAGGPPTKEIWLEMFERMEMDFDPITGKPEVTMVMHPVMVETMKKLWSEWEEDTAFMKRYTELLAENLSSPRYKDYEDYNAKYDCPKSCHQNDFDLFYFAWPTRGQNIITLLPPHSMSDSSSMGENNKQCRDKTDERK